ncbi:MAG: ribonuclease D, partial [Coriobacteriales bacterium]|nr:ribonuclease D [Coriobacteriales bacterium]
MYITSFEELKAFCERAERSKVLAIDTEFLRERTYHPMLCLIQVATHSETVAIDPLAIDDLGPLKDLFMDTGKTKVFHACDQDLEVIDDAMGILPKPVFDTQLAAAFLGHRMQLGYGALVQAYEGVRLPKADGLTDWSRRPLDEDQLAYAEDDVRYLPGIYDKMMTELVKHDRLPWLAPEIESICERTQRRRDPREAYLHLRRASSLTRKQLAVAREICAWRETNASRRNLPRKWVMSDEIVVELCRHVPRNVERLYRIRGTEGISQRDAKELVAAIWNGVKCDPAQYPLVKHRPRTSADADSVTDLMYALLRLCSENSGVAIPLIATREDLYDFMAGR